MNVSLAKQRGHAALLFAMMIPAFFAVFILASDGARALQSKARLEDASEVAVLAIAARNADSDEAGNVINKQIATDYISQYMGDMKLISEIEVVKSRSKENEKESFFQFAIHTKTEHLSWFPGKDAIAGFGEKFTVAGSATARKYQSEAVDVMFVTDFSTSMLRRWGKDNSRIKIDDLKAVFKDITDELQKFNELSNGQNNTVGNVSFNDLTRSKMSSSQDTDCIVSQLIWENDGHKYSYQYIDKKIDELEYEGWYWIRGDSLEGKPSNRPVDVQKTVNNIFTVKNECLAGNYGHFHDIELTDQLSSFSINDFEPRGNTASYEGIIRGAQLLKKGKNARRLLIVLSDGEDNHRYLSSDLVAAGMCSTIKTELNKGVTEEGKIIKARLAVIGIAYNAEENKALQDCVGESNVYSALNNKEQLRNKILKLITEEIGHLK